MARIKRLVFWLTVIGSISVTMMNLMVLFSLPDAQFLGTSSFGSKLRYQFLNPEFSSIHKQQQSHPRRRSRTLIGYFSMESRGDCYYRKRHRELFQIWNDTRVCSLYNLQKDPMRYSQCQLVYTFVMGGAMAAVGAVNTTTPISTTTSAVDDPPPMIVNNFPFPTRPLIHPHPPILKCSDKHAKDITWLNIRENMNEGKSPTFLYFASTLMKDYQIDYAMKFDADSILYLHDWFVFVHSHLPPHGHGIMGGALRHKAYWQSTKPIEQQKQMESLWEQEYDKVHLYLAGQCYFMSADLCEAVALEAPNASSYMEGFEDHDVSSMAFHSSASTTSTMRRQHQRTEDGTSRTATKGRPIHIIAIGKSQRFWAHPVKGQPRWERIRKREKARMAGELFEGKELLLYQDE